MVVIFKLFMSLFCLLLGVGFVSSAADEKEDSQGTAVLASFLMLLTIIAIHI